MSRTYLPEGHADAERAPSPADIVQPALGAAGWLRWAWRQLTSMRVALMLLMLLALAALPGSMLPQRPQAPERVARYLAENPDLGPWLDRLGFFDVFASPWFSAVYLLLFISLVGCILPRSAAHLSALRADPPRVPRSLDRFPAQASATVVGDAAAVRAVVGGNLRAYRVREGWNPAGHAGALSLSAERGYLRETGNLVFHLALVGVLVSVALGQLFHYRGQVILIEGRGFANSMVAYDSFESGPWFTDAALVPFRLTLERFESVFDPATLLPEDFTAHVAVAGADGPADAATIKVNHPLGVGGAKVYLSGNGYAPVVTVRDGAGQVAFSGPVPFLPQDAVYTSRGVLKVPDVGPGQDQLGFAGFLLPSAVVDDDVARSIFPQPLAPALVLSAFRGDLGLDDGIPQNVYELDTSAMAPVGRTDGAAGSPQGAEPARFVLRLGEEARLPDGLGSISFDALPRFVALDLRHDPALGAVLGFSLAATAGLAASLFTPRRRVWVTFTEAGAGRTVVRAAGLARGDDPGLQADVDRALAGLSRPEEPPAVPEVR